RCHHRHPAGVPSRFGLTSIGHGGHFHSRAVVGPLPQPSSPAVIRPGVIFMRRPFITLCTVAVALSAACTPEPENPADLVLRGGKVVTVDSTVPDGEAIA